jgi:hypothetical protein
MNITRGDINGIRMRVLKGILSLLTISAAKEVSYV